MTMVRLHEMRLEHHPLATLRTMVVTQTRDLQRRGFNSDASGIRGPKSWSPPRKVPSATVSHLQQVLSMTTPVTLEANGDASAVERHILRPQDLSEPERHNTRRKYTVLYDLDN